MELNIGSNIFQNTNGILNISGKNQIFLEIGEEDQRLLVSMDVYDSGGRHVAKLKQNAWVFNNNNLYRVTVQPLSLRLINVDTEETVVEIRAVEQNKIVISYGAFYTHTGALLEITPHHCKIGGLTTSGNTIDSSGEAADIG
jgi:hypothetical protein